MRRMVRGLLLAAERGDTTAIKLLLAYTIGGPPSPTELTSPHYCDPPVPAGEPLGLRRLNEAVQKAEDLRLSLLRAKLAGIDPEQAIGIMGGEDDVVQQTVCEMVDGEPLSDDEAADDTLLAREDKPAASQRPMSEPTAALP